jgi:hypothetical protein
MKLITVLIAPLMTLIAPCTTELTTPAIPETADLMPLKIALPNLEATLATFEMMPPIKLMMLVMTPLTALKADLTPPTIVEPTDMNTDAMRFQPVISL